VTAGVRIWIDWIDLFDFIELCIPALQFVMDDYGRHMAALTERLEAEMNSNQENTEANEEEMETCQQKIRTNQEKIEAKIDTAIITIQERMDTWKSCEPP
jgi:transcription termination factor NusB